MAGRRRPSRRQDLPPGVRAWGAPDRAQEGRGHSGHGHRHQLPPGRGDFHGRDRVGRRGPHPAPARDRVPHQGHAHRPHRRARRRRAGRVQVRRRHQGLRLARQRGEGSDPQARHLLRGRGRAGRRRGRDAVEPPLRGVDLLLREQHQHHGGRLAPLRLPRRADEDAERLRAREEPAQGEGGQPRGRGRARGSRRGHLREAPRAAVRGPDEDQARQPVGARAWWSGR